MIEKCIGIRKARQLHRLIRHCKVTLLCLILTIVVLRGTIGAGKFGTPVQDFFEIRNRFASRKLPYRALEGRKSFVTKELRYSDDDNDLALSSRSLSSSHNVVGWDGLRREWLEKHKIVGGVNNNKPRVLLVTGSSSKACENSLGDYYLLKSIKNKVDYCRLHGMNIFYDMALLEAEMSGSWAKLILIRDLLLGHPEAEFVWWMDSDSMFTNMAFEVPWERYDGYNLVIHGWKEMVFEEKNWVGLNTGSFLIRNCQWSLDLIESWGKMGSSGKVRVEVGEILTKELRGRPYFAAGYQSAMVYLLAKEKEKWGDKVFLENEYYLNGVWDVLIDRYEKMLKNKPGFGDHRFPLVAHFVGCKPCAKVGDYSMEKCLKLMERAFNFGDNSLFSSRVKKLQNDMLNHQQAVNDELVTKDAKVSTS